MQSTFVRNICGHDPSTPAVADDRERLTYGQLRERAQQAARLVAERCGRGGYVIVRAAPDVPFVTTLLGVMFSGNTPIPVDPDLPEGPLDYIQSKSGAAGVLGPISPAEAGPQAPLDDPKPSLPAMVMFTSGTSGFPKGVIISHENLNYACEVIAEYLQYRENPSAAVVLPLHYSYALLSQVCCQLFIGGFVRLFENLRNPVRVARAIREAELQTFCGVPSTYAALRMVHRMSPLSFPTVRILCSAGAALDASAYEDIKAMFPNGTLFNNYGMTEAAPRIAYIREDDPRFLEPTCGRPIRGVEVKIVDPESHRELPEGQRGMLVVRGPNVTAGYLNDEERTRTAFTADGFLISGDLAYRDRDGYLFICGRHDDIFNVGGEKVAPLEIERLLNRLPGVASSAVTGLHDPGRGMVPVAFLQLNGTVSRKQLQEGLNGHLSMNKYPQRFFEVRDFPTTSNGKLMRRRLSIDGSDVVREIL